MPAERFLSSAPDLPEPIPMRVPNSKPLRSWAREAFSTPHGLINRLPSPQAPPLTKA